MTQSYLLCDDGLTECYLTLAAAIVQQAFIDYTHKFENIITLQTPCEQRTPKMKRKAAHLTYSCDADFALGLAKAEAQTLKKWFGSKEYYMLTHSDPDCFLRQAEETAVEWARDGIKRGKQLHTRSLDLHHGKT